MQIVPSYLCCRSCPASRYDKNCDPVQLNKVETKHNYVQLWITIYIKMYLGQKFKVIKEVRLPKI